MATNENIFDPVKLSLEENSWLTKHLGEPWIVAQRDIRPQFNPQADPRKDKNPVIYPDGVNPNAVKPVIEKVYELIELEKATGDKWSGIEHLKKAIEIYLAQAARWKADRRRGAPRFPSLSSYDTKGRPHTGGPGSDAGQVKSFFSPDGTRTDFAVEYVPTGSKDWVADWAEQVAEMDQPVAGLNVNRELNRIECFCGHTESFNPDSRHSFNGARGRISRHLRKDTTQKFLEQHRELHTAEFGGR